LGGDKNTQLLLRSHNLFITRTETKTFRWFTPPNFFLIQHLQIGQSLQSRPHRINRVIVTDRFGQNILNTGGFQNCPYPTTGDNPRTGRRRAQKHFACPKVRYNFVRNSITDHRYFNQVFLGIFTTLTDRIGDFARFTDTRAYVAVTVTYHHNRTKAKTATTFDYLCHAVDPDYPLLQI
jgi:hypothetical protein